MGSPDLMVVLLLNFGEPYIEFSRMDGPLRILPTLNKGFLFFTFSPALMSYLLNDSYSNRCEVISLKF